jgi:hypothetical protein
MQTCIPSRFGVISKRPRGAASALIRGYFCSRVAGCKGSSFHHSSPFTPFPSVQKSASISLSVVSCFGCDSGALCLGASVVCSAYCCDSTIRLVYDYVRHDPSRFCSSLTSFASVKMRPSVVKTFSPISADEPAIPLLNFDGPGPDRRQKNPPYKHRGDGG